VTQLQAEALLLQLLLPVLLCPQGLLPVLTLPTPGLQPPLLEGLLALPLLLEVPVVMCLQVPPTMLVLSVRLFIIAVTCDFPSTCVIATKLDI